MSLALFLFALRMISVRAVLRLAVFFVLLLFLFIIVRRMRADFPRFSVRCEQRSHQTKQRTVETGE
jgi:hypothetical protein